VSTPTRSRRARQVSVTGRDAFIIQKALAYAALCIEGLPSKRQEISDHDDMLGLLKFLAEDWFDYFLDGARAHINGEKRHWDNWPAADYPGITTTHS